LPLHANFGDGETGQVARVSGACAPFADEPAVVEPVWRMLAERARVLGMHSPAASERMDDPDLHLRVGERRLDPVRVAGNRYTFVIPAMEAPVRLTSRVARPCDLQPWLIDVRRLGVMVRALRVRHDRDVRDLVLDDPRLARGWWRAERQDGRPVRWTNGSAALPVAGPCVLEVELACSMHYAIDGAAPAAVAAA